MMVTGPKPKQRHIAKHKQKSMELNDAVVEWYMQYIFNYIVQKPNLIHSRVAMFNLIWLFTDYVLIADVSVITPFLGSTSKVSADIICCYNITPVAVIITSIKSSQLVVGKFLLCAPASICFIGWFIMAVMRFVTSVMNAGEVLLDVIIISHKRLWAASLYVIAKSISVS